MTKSEQSTRTRALVVGAARALFAERGYDGVGLDDIVAALPVTKGAIYHHFGDKHGLFRAVVEDAQKELVEIVATAGSATDDPWNALEEACDAFFVALLHPGLVRIVCAEAGLFLANHELNAIDEAYGMKVLHRFLDPAFAAGLLSADLDAEATARLLSGAIYYGAEWAAGGDRPAERLERVRRDFRLMVRSLRQT
ncbi:MAG: TetR/AcrR family transcriptional regulator [Spirochaetales bacterium]|nr:TetR/AcrR family transcriptional regulator [Spirochaetales bacterium]